MRSFYKILRISFRIGLALVFAGGLVWMVLLADRENADTFVGIARVVDGDSLEIAGNKIRIKGIDAPEFDQTCTNQGHEWPCGQEARAALTTLIGNQLVTCHNHGKDKYRRTLSDCDVANKSIGKWMITHGWAVSFGDYVFDEAIAQRNKLGLWQGEFDMPQDWRRKSELNPTLENPFTWLTEMFGFGN